MEFKLRFTEVAASQLESLESDLKKLKKVRKCLGLLESNPRHAGLNSHKISSGTILEGVALWESYVENNTPAAWRVFWIYGPGEREITVVAITPHP